MKPQLLKLPLDATRSFSFREDMLPYFHNRWHYHPELELIHIEKGEGTEFIGDSIRPFSDGDLLLVGSNLPHYWRCAERYFQNNREFYVKASVVHFTENFCSKNFLQLPENKALLDLLNRAKKGLLIKGEARCTVTAVMQQLPSAEETDRLLLLLKALFVIAKSGEVETLSSNGFYPVPEPNQCERMEVIYEYSVAHFKKGITLEEIASVAHLSHKSFCRYFKSRTRKTYSRFLLELKVGHACRLLMENKLTITQICYESGFNNYTNFYRYFKMITGKTPLAYQKDCGLAV